ncbi:MAG: glycosyltransferase [Planctomycetaceae bacterium]|jgi:glycosyltransferase involved in cell wall biosynthesis|nr:glycosyltransferase [Planctomycetaceae bacterium]
MSKRLKILQIIPTLDRCGAEKQMVLLATHLPKDEFDVEVTVLTRGGAFEEELANAQISTTLIKKRLKFDPFALNRLKREVKRFQPDLVHTWLFAANAYGRKAAIDCGVPRIVAGERCVDQWKSWYHFYIDRWFAAQTDRIATNSEGVKDFYVKHGLPAEKFVVIPNAVPPPETTLDHSFSGSVNEIFEEIGVTNFEPAGDYFSVSHSEYDSERKTFLPVVSELHFRQPPFIIGIVARLWQQKRIKDLLWVFETLKFVNLNFHAVIIGDGPERDMLLRLRDQWKLSDRVHFLGQRNDVPRFMKHFDILLNGSAYEGQSNSILESMAMEIPVIATDIPGNNDLVIEGVTGLLVPDGGEDFRLRRRIFVEKILFLLENKELRKKMGIAAKTRIAEHFSLEQMIQRYSKLYRTLCTNHFSNPSSDSIR